MKATLIEGRVPAALVGLEGFDACLCDPPYGLSFMGREWDHGVPSSEVWAEVLRCLKPGAMLMAFGGTRTFHRLAVAIEDAGFESRDTLCWLYGSGFPKSHDISKAIDKAAGIWRGRAGAITIPDQPSKGKEYERNDKGAPATPEAARWNGWGTALKPAWEPIILAMKPLDGTFAQNALEYGVAGLNVDGCRVGTSDNLNGGAYSDGKTDDGEWGTMHRRHPTKDYEQPAGRWPANLALDPEAAEMLDEQTGDVPSGGRLTGNEPRSQGFSGVCYGEQSEARAWEPYTDTGGPSRFFYCAKADTAERQIGGADTRHPTLKPLDLTAWLAKLLLPPKRNTPRRLLVPFCGAGSEIIGAARSGWEEAIGIDSDPASIADALQRIRGDAPLLNSVEVVQFKQQGPADPSAGPHRNRR